MFRETADVLVPFRPIPRDEAGTQSARILPATFVAPELPRNWRGKTELVADLCLSASGAVESVALVTTSGDTKIDASSVRSLEKARFEPATRGGQPVAVCQQRITLEFDGASPP